MDDLVRWLRTQLDADEETARAAARQRGHGEWRAEADAREIVEVVGRSEPGDDSYPYTPVVLQPDDDETAAHVAAWDPARVLREIDAKRRLLEEHSLTVEKVDAAPYDSFTGERRPDEHSVTCTVCGWASDDPSSACLTVRLLALPYADRPGYREEWAP
jgi:hypothetical protein